MHAEDAVWRSGAGTFVQTYQQDGNVVNVEHFGARPTGTAAANAGAIQAALTYAALSKGRVVFPALYPVTTVRVADGVRELQGPGGLQATGQFGTYGAVLELGGTQFGTTTPTNLRITSMQFVMSTAGVGAKYGIYGDCASCVIAHNNLTNFQDINGHAGIVLWSETAYTRLLGNLIFLAQPPLTLNHTAQGINLQGVVAPYGGYFTGAGTCSAPTAPAHHNTIIGNLIFGGSHGIFGRGITHTVISDNVIHLSWHRGTLLEFASLFNTISGNTYTQWYSSAVELSYCTAFTTVSGNTAHSSTANGQAAFGAYVGTADNLFDGNKMVTTPAGTLYGVYLAVNASRNLVHGNDLTGYARAGIAIDSDWLLTLPGGATDSLAVDPASSPGRQLADGASTENVLQDNILRAPTGTVAAGLSLAAMGTVGGVTNTIVKGNHVESTAHQRQWSVFEQSPRAPVASVWLTDQTWNTGFFYMGPSGASALQNDCQQLPAGRL